MIPTVAIMLILWLGSCLAIWFLLGHEIAELIDDLEELEIELAKLEQENLELKHKLEPTIIDGETNDPLN